MASTPMPVVPASDTVYINSSGQQQERLAPLIVGLLNQIKETRYARHRRLQTELPGAWLPPAVLALDETANIAPLPDLPSVVGQGGSQGVVAVFQHLQQARARWGDHGLGFLTNFQERLTFPGIWDNQTLEAISDLVGLYDHPVTATSEDPHGDARSRLRYTHSFERRPILEPSDIRAGHPTTPAPRCTCGAGATTGSTPPPTTRPCPGRRSSSPPWSVGPGPSRTTRSAGCRCPG